MIWTTRPQKLQVSRLSQEKLWANGQFGGAKAEFNQVLERGGSLREDAAQILAQLQ